MRGICYAAIALHGSCCTRHRITCEYNGPGPGAGPSTDGSGSSLPTIPDTHPHTRARYEIHKTKIYTDGTIRYGLLASNGEPNNLSEAFKDGNWKQAMDSEYLALQKKSNLAPYAA